MEREQIKTATSVLMHHLQALGAGQLEEVMADYNEDSLLISPECSFVGLAEVRAFFAEMIQNTPPDMFTAFQLIHQDVQGEIAYIVWSAKPFIGVGTDTFVIRNGKIVSQTFFTAKG